MHRAVFAGRFIVTIRAFAEPKLSKLGKGCALPAQLFIVIGAAVMITAINVRHCHNGF